MSNKQQDQATATVAPGRSIFGAKRYGPGDQFSGSAAEVARLRKLGYLIDPRRPIVPIKGTHAMRIVKSPSATPWAAKVDAAVNRGQPRKV